MRLKEFLKKNRCVRSLGKKINIYRSYYRDARDFSNSYMTSAEKKNDYRYSVMLLVHSIEKGMCMPEPRPFGFDKVKELMSLLKKFPDQEAFEYRLGVSILFEWKKFFEAHDWQIEKRFEEVCAFLESRNIDLVNCGARQYLYKTNKPDGNAFLNVVVSRHSVRDYQNKPLQEEDLELAIKAFVETPTACNRQMCRLIRIVDCQIKEALDKTVIGLPGFNMRTVNYFVVTYDLSAFAYSGERQQGMFNAGLCTMNLVNGLHASGIGSCCLQWSNNYYEDCKIRSMLKLRKSERIGVVIGCGYYLDANAIPCSVRRDKEEMYRVV